MKRERGREGRRRREQDGESEMERGREGWRTMEMEREKERETLQRHYHSELIRRGSTGRYIASTAAPPTIEHI